jgi:hypothetical protein
VVECAGLENQSPCKRTAGSNPAPSVSICSTPGAVPAQLSPGGEPSCRPVGRYDSRLPTWADASVDRLSDRLAPGKLLAKAQLGAYRRRPVGSTLLRLSRSAWYPGAPLPKIRP